MTKPAQSGGNGGKGGRGGSVWVRYTTLEGLGSPREPAKTKGMMDLVCVGQCASSYPCSHDPSLVICDFSREVDNAACTDGADNDGDGLVDCVDVDCSQNPFVTACAKDKNLKERSPEACTDNLDNDGNGLTDCNDDSCRSRQICGAGPGHPFVITTGSEESTDSSCSNGVDDDLDGKTDCKDPECRFNPWVKVCGGGERTIETCLNGKDDDGDGKADCYDPNCDRNPYVLVCNPHWPPFLAESTEESCKDGLDNDEDFFKDCRDYQCENNPLVSACGTFENTFDLCRDKKDNDGDGAADCADPNCRFNPFFGELLCEGVQKTKHVQLAAAEAFYNGVYKESDFRSTTGEGHGGWGGAAGKRITDAAELTLKNEWCQDCFDEECSFCQIATVIRTCVLPNVPAAKDGKPGENGLEGTTMVRWYERRRIDALRALFSPRQWVVGTAQANALFKRAGKKDLENAGFAYLHDVVRMRGILAEMEVDCAEKPPEQTASALLHATLCPAIAADTIRLAYLLDGRSFYGASPEVALDPHERFEDQHAAFQDLFGLLSQAVASWIDLANGLDTSFLVGESKLQYDDLAAQLEGEITIAATRENAALAQLAALEQKMAQRQQALAKIKDKVATNNQAIAKKYNSGGGLGQLVLDLAATFLKAYGGELAKNLGKGAWEELSGELATAFGGAAPGGGTPGAAPQEKSEELFDKLWKQVKDSAAKGVESDAVKAGASKVLPALDQLTSGVPAQMPERSVMVDEVANEILDASQVQITLDYLDLVLDVRKLTADYQIARMERELLELRQAMAAAAADRIEHYQSQVAELRAYDKVLLGQETYANAILLVDDLTQRYWKMLRQAEYQVLAYGPGGESELHALTKGSYDYNLKNYLDLGGNAAKVKQAFDKSLRGGASPYFRRLPAAALKPAGAAELAALQAIGLTTVPPFDGGVTPHVARVRVDHSDLQADVLLRLKRGARIDDVRIDFLASGGQPAAPAAVFLARDTLDGFRVQRNQQVDYFADFELVPRRPSGPSSGTPLHYQSLLACTHVPPACNLADPHCASPLQELVQKGDFWSCGLHGKQPGAKPWKENTFYDRSLVGEWLIVVPPDVVKSLGKLAGIEVSFVVASRDF